MGVEDDQLAYDVESEASERGWSLVYDAARDQHQGTEYSNWRLREAKNSGYSYTQVVKSTDRKELRQRQGVKVLTDFQHIRI